jgi:DNA-binding response OmpR family regulator
VSQDVIKETETEETTVTTVDDRSATKHTAESSNHKVQRSKFKDQSPKPTMLIVDDSEDMRHFLENNFNNKYDIITAEDGIEALHLLQNHEVSIIISDWMMPRMDGADLCRRVRQDQQTSHIPFIMLTAKTDDDSKVEGMDVGADTYIEKPFSVQYLEACIRNILQIRHQLMEKFSTQPLEPVTEIAQNPTDSEFLKRMNRIIEENFSNSELNVNFLAAELNISRSSLFAKIKTLAEITPNEMIQVVRLKKAAQLMKEGKYTISEISYMVGFSNPSYFSKCFQKQFNIKPAEYMKSTT